MSDSTLIITLALVTLLVGVAYGIWQLVMVRRAKKKHHHTALTEGKPEQRS
jgi:Tfp pilus assembly protein PilE